MSEGLKPIQEPPPNPFGGRTLIVDAQDPAAYPRPSAALREAGEQDQVFVRAGIYEDKVFIADRPVLLVGEGRDAVQIFSRRGGPLYLQRVPSGRISGLTFLYVGSDEHLGFVLHGHAVPSDGRNPVRRGDLRSGMPRGLSRQ